MAGSSREIYWSASPATAQLGAIVRARTDNRVDTVPRTSSRAIKPS